MAAIPKKYGETGDGMKKDSQNGNWAGHGHSNCALRTSYVIAEFQDQTVQSSLTPS